MYDAPLASPSGPHEHQTGKVPSRPADTLRERDPGKRRPVVVVLHDLYATHVDPDPKVFRVHLRQPDYYRAIQKWRAKHPRSAKLRIRPLKSDFGYSATRPVFDASRRGAGRLTFDDEFGAFLVTVGHRKFTLIRVAVGAAKRITVEQALATRPALLALESVLQFDKTRIRGTPGRRGLWEASYVSPSTGPDVLHFGQWRDIGDDALRFQSHPQYEAVAADLAAFRDQLSLYTRYNQPGLRKLLLTGPPGTGKTSILKALAQARANDMSVVYATAETVFEVIKRIAEFPRPALVIAEEIDAFYRPSSTLLSFLDGMETPRNPGGTYLIATTNYPRRIDPRILKRPGRIDRRIRVGAIQGWRQVVPIARQYLPEDVAIADKDLGTALARTTPAEMIEIINQASRRIPRNGEAVLDAEILQRVRKAVKEELALSDMELEDETPEGREQVYGRMGAGIDPIDLEDH